ncbi:MAG: hypothetical protein OXU81_09455 [Gammaproteobacteria bacterium]|nr:hypothetical protein [Gammaproteobacteria bacterium]
MTTLPPDHDAVLFALGVAECETVLATDALVGAIGVLDRARGGAEVERWAIVTSAEILRAPDRAAALIDWGMSPEAAALTTRRIAPVLASTPIDHLDADSWVAIANAHAVSIAERARLVTLAALAIDAAETLRHRRDEGVLDLVVTVETRDSSPGGPWTGLVAAPADTPGVFEHEVRTTIATLRARLTAHYPYLRNWLAPGPDATVAVRAPVNHRAVPFLFAPFVVDHPDTLDLMEAGVPETVVDPDLLLPHPPLAH